MSGGLIEWEYRLLVEPMGTYRIIEVVYNALGYIIDWHFVDPIGDRVDDLLENLIDFQSTVERVIQGTRPILTLDDLPRDVEDEQVDVTIDFCLDYVQFN